MNARFNAAFGAVVVLFSALSGCTDVTAPPPPPSARVTAFTSSKAQIAAGESVTLTFRTENATQVELVDDSGQFIELGGEVASGTATVAPARSTFYVLRVVGVGGRDSAFVQIAVDEPLREVFIIAVPEEIESGESAQLLWGAAGATQVTLQTGAAMPTMLSGGTGTVNVTPARSERYVLQATNGVNQPTISALTEVRVRPRLIGVDLQAPNGLEAGEDVTLRWQTLGAQRVVVRELSFGQLLDTTDSARLDDGMLTWTIPTLLPTGLPLQAGVPLRFEVTASSNAGTAINTVSGVVGDAPLIERVTAPAAATVGQPFTLSWNTIGAAKVGVAIGGELVFETLPGERARAAAGSVSLPSPGAQTDYVVIATNDRGVTARATVTVRPVQLPVITSFTLTPPAINAAGDSTNAQWITQNARRVQIRVANGPTLVVNSATPSMGSASIRAGSTLPLVLEAYNEAGDLVTATATVRLVGAPIASVTPTPSLAGSLATLSWTLTGEGVNDVVGLGTPRPTKIANSAAFVDLNQQAGAIEVLFADRANGSAEVIPPNGFHPIILGVERPKLWVSVNGFVSFAVPAALSANSDFTATGNTAPSMLAPYWDDLTLGPTSKVLAGLGPDTLDGERRFIIQWDKVLVGTVELTFQVQLTETGAVSFVYTTLNAQTGSTATIGVKDTAQAFVQQVSFNTASVTDDDQLDFFQTAPGDGTLDFTPTGSRLLSFVGRTGTGIVAFQVPLVALNVGDLRVSEAMPAPETSVLSTGQWVEVRNTTQVPIDLTGVTLSSTGSSADGGFTFAGVTVPADGYVVVGQTLNATDNGGSGVTVVATDLPLNDVADTVRLSLGDSTIDTLSWARTTAGRSVQKPGDGVLTGTCARTFGTQGAIGTPTQANEPCATYTVDRIPGAFVNIATGGTDLLPTASDYTGYGVIPLPVPFTYFAQQFSSINVSMVGFFTFGPPLTAAYNTTNDVMATSSAPNGTVAVFWDELVRNTNGHIYLRRDADRTIISWQDFRIYATTSSMNFQVHLIDTGVIEFHYGTFTASTPAAELRTRASSATVWLETPSGGGVQSVGVNTADTITQNSGIRFSP
ncbi:MAG: lamin tail domain-containing protein [Archangium sp.]|nr:lamin tail domain-containing protein [Archangium sp.]